jgi:hypothetical protein
LRVETTHINYNTAVTTVVRFNMSLVYILFY